MKKYMMGFDIGTEGSKGVLLDTKGQVVAYHYVGHDVERPYPGWAEQDAEKIWWGDFVKVARGILNKSGIDPKEIAGIGCSAVLPCVVPLDESGRALRNGMLYGLDTRTTEEIRELEEHFGEDKLKKLCHARMGAQFPGPKIMWIRKHEPDVYKKTAVYHTATSFLTYKLTGNHFMCHDIGSQYVPFYDFENKTWNEEMCAFCGITANQLPKLAESFECAGGVTEDAHKETGLAAGTPVAVGTADCMAETMSMCIRDGDTAVLYGSTFVFASLSEKSRYQPSMYQVRYPVDDLYAITGGTTTAASLTKWFKNNFGREEVIAEEAGGENAYDALSRQASYIAPGSDGLVVLPYFSGERTPVWDEKARGVMFGLTLEHTKAHIYRAILEGTAYSVLHNLNEIKAAGVPISRIFSAGGGTKDSLWPQIVSDVTGLEQVCLSNVLGSPAGGALLGGYAAGFIENDGFLRDTIMKSAKTYQPDLKNTEKYQKLYDIYRELYVNTADLMHRVGKIS